MRNLLSAAALEMRHLIRILCISLSLTVGPTPRRLFFIVRHAEKAATDGNDPELSVAGQNRAKALARILKDSQLKTVFVTEFKRTQETAAADCKRSADHTDRCSSEQCCRLGR